MNEIWSQGLTVTTSVFDRPYNLMYTYGSIIKLFHASGLQVQYRLPLSLVAEMQKQYVYGCSNTHYTCDF